MSWKRGNSDSFNLDVITQPATANAELQKAFVAWAQELSGHGIVITDTELVVQGWNSWFETNTGLAAQDAIGRPLLELFPDLKRRRLDLRFHAALKGEVSILSSALHNYLLQIPSRVPELGFEHMQQTGRVAPLVNDDEIIGTIAVIDDVTQRDAQTAQLRQQQERAQLLSWALAELLKTSDPVQFLQRLLQRVARHINADVHLAFLQNDGPEAPLHLESSGGLSPQEVAVISELPFESICGLNSESGFVLDPDVALQLRLQSSVCHQLRADGSVFGALVFGTRRRTPLSQDASDFLGVVAQYIGISLERMRQQKSLQDAKAELQKHADRLEHMVQERTTCLSDMVTDLESFTYTIAHDLRAPVRFIDGFVKILMEEHGGEFSPPSLKYLQKIQRSAAQMESLTRDLLMYSKVSRAGLILHSVETEKLLDEVVAELPALAQPGVLSIERPIYNVVAHPTLLKQCFHNLLQNAIKFIPAGVSPRVEVRADELKARQRVRISVRDNGIGIDPVLHKKIFGIFERGSNAKQFEGTGIGLAIVAKAVERMGGTVGVDSSAGSGSCFWMELAAVPDRAALIE